MTGRNTGQQVQIVVDNGRRERGAGDIDDVGAWKAQQHEQAQQPFLIVRGTHQLAQFVAVERHARNHHDRLRGMPIEEDAPEQLGQSTLQLGEALQLVGRARGRIGRCVARWNAWHVDDRCCRKTLHGCPALSASERTGSGGADAPHRYPLGFVGRAASERDDPLDHEALDLPAVTDIGSRKVEVLLRHPLSLEQERGRQEPATADLIAVDADVVRHA